MEAKDILTVVLSSTVLTTIITVLFNFLSKKRQDSIENITKERKEWRSELRKVAAAISMADDLEQLKKSLSDLIVRINAYGVARDSLFADTFFWERINDLYSPEAKSFSQEQLEGYKIALVNHISCILKFDWERSKAEIKGSTQSRIVYISLLICYVGSVIHLGLITITQTSFSISATLLPFSIHYILLSAYATAVVYYADKWKDAFRLRVYILFSVLGGLFLALLMYFSYYLPSIDRYSPLTFLTDMSVLLLMAPYLTLLYSAEIKAVTHRNNFRDFVLSAVISTGQAKIDKKYEVFFSYYPKEHMVNRCTGEQLTFYESDSQKNEGEDPSAEKSGNRKQRSRQKANRRKKR